MNLYGYLNLFYFCFLFRAGLISAQPAIANNVCGTPEVLRNEMEQNLGGAKRNLATAVVRCAARSATIFPLLFGGVYSFSSLFSILSWGAICI